MSSSPLAFAFPFAPEPLALGVARVLVAHLEQGEPVTRATLNSALNGHFGGTDADGRWSVRDAHAALELAQVLWLRDCASLTPNMGEDVVEATFSALEALLPSQTVRSAEQIELQQFATPPALSWLAAQACALRPTDLVLEPSAGTGMLAVWADAAKARLVLNEISPLRRECLASLFPQALLTGHNGELIDDLLDPAITPNVVLMNPPYSYAVERGHDGRTGARHVRAAWRRLANSGRLVAIMPEWFDVRAFLIGLDGPRSLRLDARIEGAFSKRGTSITTRLLVIDKVTDGAEPQLTQTNVFCTLAELVSALPVRGAVRAEAAPPRIGKPLPLQLVSESAKQRPVPPSRSGAVSEIVLCKFTALDVPAPIAEQVGHYLLRTPGIKGATRRLVAPG